MKPRPELLLHPNVPKPLHGMSPRELLGKEWWDKVRQEVYKQAEYRCQACDTPKVWAKYHKWLEAHEVYKYDYTIGRARMVEIVALCHSCHSFIHSGYLRVRLDRGLIDPKQFQEIVAAGNRLTKNLPKPTVPTEIAEWSKWHIVIGDRIFPTKWSSYEDWQKHYSEAQ